jgi:hypothetical protein
MRSLIIAAALVACCCAVSPSVAQSRYKTVEVVGQKHLHAFSGGQEQSQDDDCITPQNGGRLVTGSVMLKGEKTVGRVIYEGKPNPTIANDTPRMRNPIPTHNAGWWVKSETPQRACIEVFARASCTEAGCGVSTDGMVAAMERYRVH